MTINVYLSSPNIPVILVRFYCNLNSFGTFSKKKKKLISNFMKIRPVGAELFRADGRTDVTKLTVVLGNFVNTPKKVNFTLEQAMKVRGGRRDMAILLLQPRRFTPEK